MPCMTEAATATRNAATEHRTEIGIELEPFVGFGSSSVICERRSRSNSESSHTSGIESLAELPNSLRE
eukprot:651620-Prymnesium_polylepis.1